MSFEIGAAIIGFVGLIYRKYNFKGLQTFIGC